MTQHEPENTHPRTSVLAVDDLEHNAHHKYQITLPNQKIFHIEFQKGPVQKVGYNGLTNEILLAIVYDRLKAFELGDHPSPNNALALIAVKKALDALNTRTVDRVSRGVEGTAKP